jgi:glycosyltransferase involved in cell wall biosynthesis
MSQLKILHIVSNPFFVDRGGLVRVYEEVKATIRCNHNVYVCSYPGGRDIDDIKVYRIPWITWYKNKSGGPHDFHRLYLDFFLLFYSLYVSIKLKPSVIHTHNITGIVAGKIYLLINKKCILIRDCQGTYADELVNNNTPLFIKNLIVFIEKIFYSFPDAFLCSNVTLTEILTTKYKIKKKIITIPDGIGELPIVNVVNKSLFGINSNDKVVGYIGLLIKEQGIDFLFDAIKNIASSNAHIKFIIIGHPNDQKYQQIFSKIGLKDQVMFIGAVDYSKIYDYLAIFDIAVSPKLFEGVASNGKLLNYIAMGLPTVVFEHPVNRYYLGEFALYAKYKDANDLTLKILTLLEDDLLYKSIKDNLKNQLQKLRWDEIIKDVTELYKFTLTNLKVKSALN